MRVDIRNPISKYITCTLDGVDVTNNATDACENRLDTPGWVEVYMRDEQGEIVLDYGRGVPSKKIVYGHVVLSLKPDAPQPASKLYDALREYEQEMQA